MEPMTAKIETMIINPSLREALLNTAHGLAFPFFVVNLVKDDSNQDNELKMKVHPSIYDALEKIHGTNKLTFYWDIPSGKMEKWSPSMEFTFKYLHQYGIFSSTTAWVKKARKFVVQNLEKTKEEVRVEDLLALARLEKLTQLMDYSGLKEIVDAKEDLFFIARDVFMAQNKDPDTIVYRLAMMLYHSKRLSGAAAIPELEDSGLIYLKLSDNANFKLEYEGIYNGLSKIEPRSRSAVVKTLMSFVIGGYLYYKERYETQEDAE